MIYTNLFPIISCAKENKQVKKDNENHSQIVLRSHAGIGDKIGKVVSCLYTITEKAANLKDNWNDFLDASPSTSLFIKGYRSLIKLAVE